MTEHAALPGILWWRVIVDLEQSGYSHAAIGAAIDAGRATVERWKNGYGIEPRHEDGERLISLWCAVMALRRDELPRKVHKVLSAAAFR